MASIHVKQCTLTEGQEPRFYADLGDTVTIRAKDGSGLVVATLETIVGDRVTVRYLHGDEVVEMPAAEVVGVIHS
jgi:hypothetical protein